MAGVPFSHFLSALLSVVHNHQHSPPSNVFVITSQIVYIIVTDELKCSVRWPLSNDLHRIDSPLVYRQDGLSACAAQRDSLV